MTTKKKTAEEVEQTVETAEEAKETAETTEEVKETAESTEPEAEKSEEEELSQTAKAYQRYYQKGFWNKKMLKNAVKKGKITAREYEIITGEAYE